MSRAGIRSLWQPIKYVVVIVGFRAHNRSCSGGAQFSLSSVHLRRSVCGAQSAAEEAEHGEDLGKPAGEHGLHVISHGPSQTIHSVNHGERAEAVVLGEEEGSDGNKDGELEDTGKEGAVDRAGTEAVSPGTNKHEDGVDANDGGGDTHKNSDKSELGALGLAVDVTVINHIEERIKVFLVEVVVVVADRSTRC